MEVSFDSSDGCRRLIVEGRVDALESPDLSRHVDEAVADDPTHLVIDLYNVDYLDSSGLAVLVRAWRAFEASDRRFSLVMPATDEAKRIFTLAGFDQIFDVVDAPIDSGI